MFKKILFLIVISGFLLGAADAHNLILNVYRNVDDTVTIEAGYDTGNTAAGAMVRLESLATGEILFEERLPQESEVTLAIPDEPYRIVLDGGPEHTVMEEGIPPEKGFSDMAAEEKKSVEAKAAGVGVPFVILITLAFGLLLLTIFISIRNTNKILEAISQRGSHQ